MSVYGYIWLVRVSRLACEYGHIFGERGYFYFLGQKYEHFKNELSI